MCSLGPLNIEPTVAQVERDIKANSVYPNVVPVNTGDSYSRRTMSFILIRDGCVESGDQREDTSRCTAACACAVQHALEVLPMRARHILAGDGPLGRRRDL